MSGGNKLKFLATMACAGLAVLMNYIISIALTPYITSTLGTEAYGFVSLAKTFSQYATVFTAALNSYAARFIAMAHHKNDREEEKKYFSSVFYANVILAAVILSFSLVLVFFLDKMIQIPMHLVPEVKILFLLNFVNYMVLSTGTCFSVYGYIQNRLTIVNLVKVIAYVMEACCLIFMFAILPTKLYYVGIALLLSSICIFSLNALVCRKGLPELSLDYHYFSIAAVKKLFFSGVWNSVNSLGNILNSGLDLLVSNLMLSALAMGQVSIVKTLSVIFLTLFQTVFLPWQPILLKKYSLGNMEGVISDFKLGMKVTAFFSNLLFGGLMAFGTSYFLLWTGDQDVILLNRLLQITLVGLVIEGASYSLLYTYTLTLKNKIPSMVTIGCGLLNVVGMFALLKYTNMGIYAVVLTTSVIAWLVYFVFTPIYTARCLKVSWYTFYPTLLRILGGAVACMMVCFGVSRIFRSNTWSSLIFCVLICTVLYTPIYALLVLSKKEIRFIFSILKNKGKKVA